MKKRPAANQIRPRREAAGLAAADLAKKVGIGVTYLSMLELGDRTGPIPVWESLARELGCTVEDLRKGPDEVVPVPPAGYMMPVRAIVKAGPVAEAVEIQDNPIGYEPSLLPVDDRCHALEIHGDSMSPALEHGDRIVVEIRDNPESGETVLAEYHDPSRPDDPPLLTVKLYMREGSRELLVPLNPRYETRVFDRRHWKIRGVVVKAICRNLGCRLRWMLQVPNGETH